MTQLHKRFSDEQIVFLMQAHEQALTTRDEVHDTLDSNIQFIHKAPKLAPEGFSSQFLLKG